MTRGGKPRSGTRRRGDSAGERRGSPFDPILEDAASLLDTDDPVEAELFASGIVALAGAPGPMGPAFADGDAFATALAGEARAQCTRASLALLLALSEVAPPSWRQIVWPAAQAVVAQGIDVPPWMGSIGSASFAGAWLGTDPFGDHDLILVSFQHRGQSPHALQLLVDHNQAGIIRDAQLVPEVAEVLEGWRAGMSDLEFRQLGATEVSTRVTRALEMSSLNWTMPPWTDDFRRLRALIAARLEAMPSPRLEPEREPMPGEVRAALVKEFLGSPEGEPARREDSAVHLLDSVVDCRADYVAEGDPLRWSPEVVEGFADQYVRKMEWEADDLRRLPDLLAAWIRFAGRRRGIPDHLLRQTLEAVVANRHLLEDAGRHPQASRQASREDDEAIGGLANDDEIDDFVEMLELEEAQAVEVMRDALPELRALPTPPELEEAATRLRRELPRAYRLRPVRRAAGWKKLPADDRELWLGTVGGLVAMREESGLEAEDESAIMALDTADWVGAVVGLVRAGRGADARPPALVGYADRSPEIESTVDRDDAELMEYAFELVLPAWEAAGVVTQDRRLTELGRWGLPRALAWAWGRAFD